MKDLNGEQFVDNNTALQEVQNIPKETFFPFPTMDSNFIKCLTFKVYICDSNTLRTIATTLFLTLGIFGKKPEMYR